MNLDRDKLRRLKPLLDSEAWRSIEEYMLEPLVEELRTSLESCPPDNIRFVQGQVYQVRRLLMLRDNAKIMEQT